MHTFTIHFSGDKPPVEMKPNRANSVDCSVTPGAVTVLNEYCEEIFVILDEDLSHIIIEKA